MIVPFEIKAGSAVLISGCGGGFDFLCGSPIGMELERCGHKVVYSSYSFSSLADIYQPKVVAERLVEVGQNDRMKGGDYFPEKHFCDWHAKTLGTPTKVYCYQGVAVRHLTAIFNELYQREGIDCHIVVDGGCDGIFRGDEYDLGTPSTDAVSIIAASLSAPLARKVYALTAFGTEGVGKEVSHSDVLRRISELMALDKFLGVSSIANNHEMARLFLSAFDHISASMPSQYQSTIVSSIAASLRGAFGDQAVNLKTKVCPVWISPLTSLIWYMDVSAVAQSKLYYDQAVAAETSIGVHNAIERFIAARPKPTRETIPI